MKNQIYPCLWFDGKAKEAAVFYCSIFKHSKILEENPIVVRWELDGQQFMGLNGGPLYKFGVSWQIVPKILGQLMADPEKSERVIEAFMKMKKNEIEKLKKA